MKRCSGCSDRKKPQRSEESADRLKAAVEVVSVGEEISAHDHCPCRSNQLRHDGASNRPSLRVCTGKTHGAMDALIKAKTGIYCAPLRLLAWEVRLCFIASTSQSHGDEGL